MVLWCYDGENVFDYYFEINLTKILTLILIVILTIEITIKKYTNTAEVTALLNTISHEFLGLFDGDTFYNF